MNDTQYYKQFVKEVKSANAMLQRLRGHLGDHYGWAGKKLTERLSSKALNMITEKGYIKYNKNLSATQMKAALKAIENFKASKTSTQQGVQEAIENAKEKLRISMDITGEEAELYYEFFETDKYNMSDDVKYEALLVGLSLQKENITDEQYYLDRMKDYIDFGNDENVKTELLSIFDMINSGQINWDNLKRMKKM